MIPNLSFNHARVFLLTDHEARLSPVGIVNCINDLRIRNGRNVQDISAPERQHGNVNIRVMSAMLHQRRQLGGALTHNPHSRPVRPKNYERLEPQGILSLLEFLFKFHSSGVREPWQ